MFNKRTCKVQFHIAVWSLSKCYKSVWFNWKLSSNQRKTNRFPAKFVREALTKSAILYQSFYSETGLGNSRKIGRFFRKICPWKSCEIWLFFLRPTRSPVFCSYCRVFLWLLSINNMSLFRFVFFWRTGNEVMPRSQEETDQEQPMLTNTPN